MSAWRAGLARREITAYEPGMAMLGWGRIDHRVREVAAPLHVRALVVVGDDGPVAVAVLDLCFVPQLVRAEVLARLSRADGLGLDAHRVLLLATHTHCGPAGITDSVLYGAPNLGFSPGVTDHVVDATVEALRAAAAAAVPARLRLARGRVPYDEPVVFQRSLRAHRANPGLARVRAEDALDRSLPVLRVEDLAGRELGLLAVIASHGTTVHGDVPVLHPDHPGLAACRLEAARGPGHVALVAQGAAGDVTPNHRWSAARGLRIGTFDDDLASAADVAARFAGLIARVADDAATRPPLAGPVTGRARHVDLASAPGAGGVRTRPPAMGLSFPAGTDEGPGPLGVVAPWLHRVQRLRRRWLRLRGQHRDPDAEFHLRFGNLDQGLHGRLFHHVDARLVARLRGVDPVLDALAACDREGLPVDRCWVPTVLPVQALRLGSLSLVALAGEPTTAAGAALAAEARAVVGGDVVVLGYANAYAGYVSTPEAYEVQAYEGGHTLFGRHTLAAWRQAVGDVLRQEASALVPGPSPVIVPRDVLVREREVMRWGLSRRHRHLVAGQDGSVRTR